MVLHSPRPTSPSPRLYSSLDPNCFLTPKPQLYFTWVHFLGFDQSPSWLTPTEDILPRALSLWDFLDTLLPEFPCPTIHATWHYRVFDTYHFQPRGPSTYHPAIFPRVHVTLPSFHVSWLFLIFYHDPGLDFSGFLRMLPPNFSMDHLHPRFPSLNPCRWFHLLYGCLI